MDRRSRDNRRNSQRHQDGRRQQPYTRSYATSRHRNHSCKKSYKSTYNDNKNNSYQYASNRRCVQITSRAHDLDDRPRSGHSQQSGLDESNTVQIAEKFIYLLKARIEGTMRLYDQAQQAVFQARFNVQDGKQKISDVLVKNCPLQQNQWAYYDKTSKTKYRGYFSLVQLYDKRKELTANTVVRNQGGAVGMFANIVQYLPIEYKEAVKYVENAESEQAEAELRFEVAQEQLLQLREIRSQEQLAQAIHQALSHDRQQFYLDSSNHNHKQLYTPYQLLRAIRSDKKIRNDTKVFRKLDSPSHSQTVQTVVNNWQNAFANLIAKLVYIQGYEQFQEIHKKHDISDLKQKIWACKGDDFKNRYSLCQFLEWVEDDTNSNWNLTSGIFHESQKSQEFCGIQIFSAVAFVLSEKALGYYRDGRVKGGLQIFQKGAVSQNIKQTLQQELVSSLESDNVFHNEIINMLKVQFEKSVIQNTLQIGTTQTASHANIEHVYQVQNVSSQENASLGVECGNRPQSASKRVVTVLKSSCEETTNANFKNGTTSSKNVSNELLGDRPKSAPKRVVSFLDTEHSVPNESVFNKNLSGSHAQKNVNRRVDVSAVPEDSKLRPQPGQKRPASCSDIKCSAQKRPKFASDQNQNCSVQIQNEHAYMYGQVESNQTAPQNPPQQPQQKQIADVSIQRYQLGNGVENIILNGDACIDQIKYDQINQNGRCQFRSSRSTNGSYLQLGIRSPSEFLENQHKSNQSTYQNLETGQNFVRNCNYSDINKDKNWSQFEQTQQNCTTSDVEFLQKVHNVREKQQQLVASNSISFGLLDTGQKLQVQCINNQIGIGPPNMPVANQSLQSCENQQNKQQSQHNSSQIQRKNNYISCQFQLSQVDNTCQQIIDDCAKIENCLSYVSNSDGQQVETCQQQCIYKQQQVSTKNNSSNNSSNSNCLQSNDLIVQQVLYQLVDRCCNLYFAENQEVKLTQPKINQFCPVQEETQAAIQQPGQDVSSDYLLLFNTDISDSQKTYLPYNIQVERSSLASTNPALNKSSKCLDNNSQSQNELKEIIGEQMKMKSKRTPDLSGSSLRSVATSIFLKDSSCCADQGNEEEQEQEQEQLFKNQQQQQEQLQTPVKNLQQQQILQSLQCLDEDMDEEKERVEFIRQGTGSSTSAENNGKPQRQRLRRQQQKNNEQFCQLLAAPPEGPNFQCNFLQMKQPSHSLLVQDHQNFCQSLQQQQLLSNQLGCLLCTPRKGEKQQGCDNFGLGVQTKTPKTPESIAGVRDMMAHVRPFSGRTQSYREFLDEADPVYQQYLQGTPENAGVYSLLEIDMYKQAQCNGAQAADTELGLDLYGDKFTCSEINNDANFGEDMEAREFSPLYHIQRLQQQMVPLGNLQRSTSLQVRDSASKLPPILKASSLDSTKLEKIQSLSFDANNIPTLSLEKNKLDDAVSNLSFDVHKLDQISEDLNMERAISAAPSFKVHSSSWCISSAESDTSSDYDFAEELEQQKCWRMQQQHRLSLTKAKKMDGSSRKRKLKGQGRIDGKKRKIEVPQSSDIEDGVFQFEFDEDYIPLKIISIPQGPIERIAPTFYSSFPLHPQFQAYPYRYCYQPSLSTPSTSFKGSSPPPSSEKNAGQIIECEQDTTSCPVCKEDRTITEGGESCLHKNDNCSEPALSHVPPIAPIISPPPGVVRDDILAAKLSPIKNPPIYAASETVDSQNGGNHSKVANESKIQKQQCYQQDSDCQKERVHQTCVTQQQQDSNQAQEQLHREVSVQQQKQLDQNVEKQKIHESSQQSLANLQTLNPDKETEQQQNQPAKQLQLSQDGQLISFQQEPKNGFVKNGRNGRSRTLSQAHLEALKRGRERKRTQKNVSKDNQNIQKAKLKGEIPVASQVDESQSEKQEQPILSKQDSFEKLIENKNLSQIQKIKAQVILESSEDELINSAQKQTQQKTLSLKKLLKKIDSDDQSTHQTQRQDGKHKHKKLRAKNATIHKTVIVRDEDNSGNHNKKLIPNGKTQKIQPGVQNQKVGGDDEEFAWKLHHELNEAQLQRRLRERPQRNQLGSKIKHQMKEQNNHVKGKTLRQQNALRMQQEQQQIQLQKLQSPQQYHIKQNSVIQSLTNGYTRKNTTDYAIFGTQKLHPAHKDDVKTEQQIQPTKSLRTENSKIEVKSSNNKHSLLTDNKKVVNLQEEKQQQQQNTPQSRPQSPLIKKGNRIIIESSEDEEKEKQNEIHVPKKEVGIGQVLGVVPKTVVVKRQQRCSSDSDDDDDDIERYKKMKFMCTSEYAEQHSKHRKHSARSKHALGRIKGGSRGSFLDGAKFIKKKCKFVKQEGEVVSTMSVPDMRRLKASTTKKLPQQAGRTLLKLSDMSRPCSADVKTSKQSRNQQGGIKLNGNLYQGKKLSFGKSEVHAWGLFADEDITKGDFVIEYIGQLIRSPLADVREKYYESRGNLSSYFFRLDKQWVVDAMEVGGLARFINHSCDPNCYTKIVKQESTGEKTKAIAIFALRNISKGEELFYDYKFPEEDMKLVCSCGAKNCRGYLN